MIRDVHFMAVKLRHKLAMFKEDRHEFDSRLGFDHADEVGVALIVAVAYAHVLSSHLGVFEVLAEKLGLEVGEVEHSFVCFSFYSVSPSIATS